MSTLIKRSDEVGTLAPKAAAVIVSIDVQVGKIDNKYIDIFAPPRTDEQVESMILFHTRCRQRCAYI